MRKCLIWNPLTPPVASAFEAFGHSSRTTHRPHRGEVHRPRRWESAGIHTWRRETSRDTKAAQDEATPIGYLLISRPPIRISAPRLNLPTFDGHPRRGALREVMLKILSRENLATRLSQAEARVSFQGIWEMLPNASTFHPCARTLVSPMWSVCPPPPRRCADSRCD